jgi:hypothetical protein
VVRLHRADGTRVVTDLGDDLLLVSTGYHGRAVVQTRDLTSGALIRQSSPITGVSEPRIGGTFAHNVWIAEATGMAGYASRLILPALTPQPVPKALTFATNAINATVWGHILYITQPAGGAARNYCADPTTGRSEATLPVPATGQLLTADTRRLFFVTAWRKGRSQYLRARPIPRACIAATPR